MSFRWFLDKIPIFNKTYFHYYKVFHEYIGHRILLLGSLSFVITLTEGLGIAVFFSYIQQLAGGNNSEPTAIIEKLYWFLGRVGIPQSSNIVVLTVIFLFVIRGVLILAFNAYQYSIYMLLTKEMTNRLVGAVTTMSYREYLTRNAGYFSHLITKEIGRCVTAYYQISAILPKAISIFTYLFLSFRINPIFTFLSIGFGVFISIIFRTVTSHTKAHSMELSRVEGSQANLAIQMLTGFKYLYSTNRLSVLRGRLAQSTNTISKIGADIGKLSAIIPASSEPLIVAFIASSIYLQVNYLGGTISGLFIAVMFLYRVMKEASVMQSSWQTFNSYVGAVDQIVDAIHVLEKSKETNGTQEVQNISHEIRVDNVSFKYAEKEVLKNISLIIPAKKMVAFVGESGSGKSTLVDLITGLLRPTSGSVVLDGIPYGDLDLRSLGRKVGYVTQEPVLFDDSVANNVSLWEFASSPQVGEKIRLALQNASCLSFVDEMPEGIRTSVGDRGIKLSGGQKQRLCIARELYKQPQLLILDEATSALDSETERVIQQSIDQLRGKATIIVIAHRLSTIINCDLVCVLKEGKIIEMGGFQELLNQRGSELRRLCELQGISI